MKYDVVTTTRFRKELKLMLKRKLDVSVLDEIVDMLADDIPLPEANCDHALTGRWAGHRGCHIQPDWILIYRIEQDVLVLSLTRTGSHSDLF